MKFQYIFLTFFGLMAVIAVIVFSQTKSTPTNNKLAGVRGTVVVWGTFDDHVPAFTSMVADFNQQYQGSIVLNYQYHDAKSFDNDIIEALAAGKGPDVLLLPDDLVLRHSNKIQTIPYTTMDQRTFKDTFIDAAEIYLRPEGVLALPFAVDPLVLYWNRDIFANASLALPPKFWDEVLVMTPGLTRRDRDQNIVQSAIALGEFVNVHRAKDILAMLFLQVGNPIVSVVSGRPEASLAGNMAGGDAVRGAESALRFYVDFTNPLKSIYTWNRSRGDSRDEFINGNLAMYLDYASTYRELKTKNPHLNFDVAPVPQPRDARSQITIGKVYGLAAMKTSKNLPATYVTIQLLLDPKYAQAFSNAFSLPPVRKDLLAKGSPGDAVLAVFYDAAIRSRSWLDPKPADTDDAFRTAVESLSSGVSGVNEAIQALQNRLEALLKPYNSQ